MIRDVLQESGLTFFATAGLVMFVLVFVGVCLWTFSRKGGEVRGWSALPLHGDEDLPFQQRDPQRPRGEA